MKLLHTSDWHLGQNFMGQSRLEEHKVFLDWLIETIEEEAIDLLIVAGDIFDTSTPPNYALELYYNFITKISKISQIIIIAGNHDSIATLNAPKQLLSTLNVSVVTNKDEIIEIYNGDDMVCVVCAVPFLRDSAVRYSKASQTMSQKELSLSSGIKELYNRIYLDATKCRGERDIPIIATGHLTTVGSKSSDSEREIYIGGSLDIDSDFLGNNFDYVALGHLHINQKVGSKNVYYSGSPIPLSFSEAGNKKMVNIVTIDANNIAVKILEIPLYRSLVVIRGDEKSVTQELHKIEDKKSWIEVYLEDDNPFFANQTIRTLAKELDLILLAVKIDQTDNALHSKDISAVSLDELKPIDLFNRRMDMDGFEDKELRGELIREFSKIVDDLEEL